MRFYRSDDGQWFATQAEARAHAKAVSTRWGPVEVPTDKPGLLAWLAAQAAPSPETLLGPQGDIKAALGAEPADPVLDAQLAPIREPLDTSQATLERAIAIEEAILAADPARLATLATLLAARQAELAR